MAHQPVTVPGRPVITLAGTHDPGFTRNRLVTDGLRSRGFAVTNLAEPAWGSTEQRVRSARRGLVNPGLAWRLARAYARVATRLARQPAGGVTYLGYPGQLDTIMLRLLAPGRPLVLDAFIAIDETLADRGLAGPPGSPTRLVARLVDRLAFRLADLVVVDTRAHLRRFSARYGLDPRKAVVVPVGAEDPDTKAPASMESEDRGSRALRVLYFGGFIPLHGVPIVVDAARRLPQDGSIQIDLVGDGQDADAAEAELARSPLPHLRLLRTWTSERALIDTYIADADVCLGIFAATPKALDVVPAKVYLALACRKAVLTADTPAVREELLTHAPGGPPVLTSPAGDAQGLADALLRLRDDGALRARLATAGRRLYEQRFRPELIVEQLVPALQALGATSRR
jgi:glycosyltransferase involved in cell wall biosynthesis